MKLRHIALSIAAASAIGAAATSYAQSDAATSPPAAPPDSISPYTLPSPQSSTTVIVVPDAAPSPDLTYNSRTGLPNGTVVTEPGGMTPQERRDTAGTEDRATGQVTAPGYMGPRDSRGQ